MNKKLNILYIAIDPSLGGSTASLYNLICSTKDNINPIVLMPHKGTGYDFFVQKGIETHIYPFIRLYEIKKNTLFSQWRHPWRWHYIKKLRFDYGCLRFVNKILAGRKVDIVHTNTRPNDIGVLLARKLQAKHVWQVREFCDLHAQFDIYKGIPRLRNLINHADARIAISSAIKDHWQMPDTNTWVIHNAIRSINDACYISDKKKYLLFSSYNLTEAKGTRKAIIAFAKSGIANGYTLKLMGNCTDEYKESLAQTINEYGVSNRVEFVPFQIEVKSYFAHATAYIMASEFEGLGRVTGEAMFFGCPVIAYASGGTLDLVKHGETGYLYYSIEECAELIKQVCETSQENLIKRAQEFAIMDLSQEVYGPKIIEVYKTILNR